MTSDLRPLTSERAVALVLTLILLSVALVMALAFLAISGRERNSVSTQTDATAARLATDAGLSAAEAQIAANMLADDNPYSFGLLVSTNYINAYGFRPGVVSPTNVNFNYLAGGGALDQAQMLQNLANLSILPRAPVWLSNTVTHAMEDRFYLDLNRNGVDDPNGWVTNVDANGNSLGTVSFQVGDPEWIGVLQHPDQPYGPNNLFIARYAFIALPVGNSLDLNAIHNQVFDESGKLFPVTVNPNPANNQQDAYFRNQGVGTWELNLAAFLADLNTNVWLPTLPPNPGYYYYQYLPQDNSGRAFDDARALLTFRYANNYNSLASVDNLFGGPPLNAGQQAFIEDGMDGYSDGPLQTGFESPETTIIPSTVDNPSLPWAGADNTNHYFDLTADLFDPNKTALGVSAANNFPGRLLNAGTGKSTYDRYTFYRLLAQLGTDSAPAAGKMNLNYDNLHPYLQVGGFPLAVSNGVVASTNFAPWTPLGFFTNAADRLLKAYTTQWAAPNNGTGAAFVSGPFNVAVVNTNFVATFNVTAPFGVTDIPVWISNRFVYTPAVNRLLQLAANLYDATTLGNDPGTSPAGQVAQPARSANYPSIFRPIFTVVPENGFNDVYITGYTNQNPFVDHASQMVEIAPAVDVTALVTNGLLSVPVTFTNVNVYGVPWIIGAKKGLPNFNAFDVESAFELVRKLEVQRDLAASTQPDILWTNQMYQMNLTNYLALSCWNSYQSNYPGPVDIVVRCSSAIELTNDDNMALYFPLINFAQAQELTPDWPAWGGVPKQQSPSFAVPLNESVVTLNNAVYVYAEHNLFPTEGVYSNYYDKGIRELPHFWLLMTNRLQVAIIDYSTNVSPLNASTPTVGRIVDYVQLGGMDSSELLNAALPENDPNSCWNTNYDSQGNLIGAYNQIHISENGTTATGQTPTGSGAWSTAQIPNGPANNSDPAAQQAFFRGFFSKDGSYDYDKTYYNTQSVMQAPYTPFAFAIQHTTWEANDPLVHYLASDLAPVTYTNLEKVDFNADNLRVANVRYQPWGVPPPNYATGADQNPANLAFKDPLVRGSDNWDFPSYKLPNVGWLGRVHRGTPWQSVYLKATNILDWANSVGQNGLSTWQQWTGDRNPYDAVNSSPTADWLLFDLFTTAFNDNATRGQLSVNVSGNSLAAWSAVFSGVTVLSNNLPNFVVGLSGYGQAQKPVPGSSYSNPPSYSTNNIQPAGAAGYDSALGQLVAGIDRTRATFVNPDGLIGAFEHKGDILATPQLTEQSPFLNWSSTAQQANGISDEMYEWLPQQVMGLLQASDAPRYVIYSYGQALKPAKNGLYLGAGAFFDLVTNYQVVAESATRTVVQFDTARTNVITATNSVITLTPPRAVIESSNLLPPN